MVGGCLLARRGRRRCGDVVDDGSTNVRSCIVALMLPDLLMVVVVVVDDAIFFSSAAEHRSGISRRRRRSRTAPLS